MVSMRDRALIEARARGIGPGAALKGQWRQMLRFDIIGSAFAIAVFLLLYYIAGRLPRRLLRHRCSATPRPRPTALGNWYWIANAIALIVTGLLSDRLRVRKPFMIVGAADRPVGSRAVRHRGHRPDTTTHTHSRSTHPDVSVGGAMAYVAWMAAFTETVEKHNPAATATGLAVWGAILRTVVVVALIGLIYAIPAAGTLVDSGQKVQVAAAGLDPNLTPAQNATVKAVAAPGSTIVADLQSKAAKYKDELATAAKLKPATQAALAANPNDPSAQAEALSEISGKPVADVVKVITMSTQYKDQLATAAALSPATQGALLTNPTDPATQAAAIGEIMAGLKITQAEAIAKLQALAAVPAADLIFLATNAPGVLDAVAKLTALSKVPAADLTFLGTYGPQLQDPKVLAQLDYLQKEAPGVQRAVKDSPIQWQRWWWICLGGQIVFLPFIWLLTGRWSPRKAREDAEAHAEAVNRELAALSGGQAKATA